MDLMRKLLGLMLLLALSACGGGGGDAGSPVLGGGSGGSGGSAAASVADLVLVLSKPSVDNSGSQTATLTVTAVDEIGRASCRERV